MPRIEAQQAYDGAEERLARLGLRPLWNELIQVLTGFELLVEETRHSNGAGAIRAMIDQRFQDAGGWINTASGGIDWKKCHVVNGTRICIGVEVQFSGRSDLLIVDVAHLREALTAGEIDVGVIVTSSDVLAPFLTDRVAHYRAAISAVRRARAEDHPLIVLSLLHDGSGPQIKKVSTNRGRAAGLLGS